MICPCFGKGKVFPDSLTNLVNIQRQHEKGKWIICVSEGVYTLFKKMFFLFHPALLKCFTYSRVSLIVLQFLSRLPRLRSRWFLFIRTEKIYLLFNLFTKCSQKQWTTRKIMLTLTSTIAFSIENISSKVSTINNHFKNSSMNISQTKSTNFPKTSISILSISPSTIATLSGGLHLLQW